nr:hypothetical protein [Tanacetum cinerariifolium]
MGEEFEVVEPSGTRTDSSHSLASSDSTTPLSPDHPLTHISPTPTPTCALFHRRTARMTVRVQPAMSPGHSARVTWVMALSDLAFCKRYRSFYESPSSSSSLDLLVQKRYQGTSELMLDTDSVGDELGDKDIKEDEEDESLDMDDEGERDKLGLEEEVTPKGQQQVVSVVDTAVSEPLGLGYGAARRRTLESTEEITPSTYKVGQSSRSMPEQQGADRVSTFRHPTLTTWVDLEDDRVYTDILVYLVIVWFFLISPSSPIVLSPIASPVATPTATKSVGEDQFIEVGAQLELHRSILQDHTQRLDALPPTLIADIGRDVRELYTRSGVVRYEIFSQRYRFRSLEREQQRTAVTFGALWRHVLALEAWAGHVDTLNGRYVMGRYDDHRIINDMLV